MVTVPKFKKIVTSLFKKFFPVFMAVSAGSILLLIKKSKFNEIIAGVIIALYIVCALVITFVEVDYVNKVEDKDTGDETTKYNKEKQLNKIKKKRTYLSLSIFSVLILLLALLISFIAIKPPSPPVRGFIITKPYYGKCFKKPEHSPVTINIEGITSQKIGNNEKLKVNVMNSEMNSESTIASHCQFITATHDRSTPQNWQIHDCTIPNTGDFIISVYMESDNNIKTQDVFIHVMKEVSLKDKAGDIFWKLFDIAVKKQ
jgi:hypothetical protein